MLTLKRAQEKLRYDPDTGILLIWARKKWRVVGRRAKPGRYRFARIDGKSYIAHRLIWLLVHGAFPTMEIDHKNCDRSDNRLANLRLATSAQNSANLRTIRNGLKGAYRNGTGWSSRIQVKGQTYHLGTYPTEQEAHEAYVKAARQHFGEFARAA